MSAMSPLNGATLKTCVIGYSFSNRVSICCRTWDIISFGGAVFEISLLTGTQPELWVLPVLRPPSWIFSWKVHLGLLEIAPLSREHRETYRGRHRNHAPMFYGLVWFGFLTAHQHKKAISARSTIKLWLLYLKSNYFVSCINSKTYNNEKSEKPLVASYDRQVLTEAVFY